VPYRLFAETTNPLCAFRLLFSIWDGYRPAQSTWCSFGGLEWNFGRHELRFAAQSFCGQLAAAIMLAAVIAFTFQATFIASSEAATEETSLYHHGFARSHPHPQAHHHEVAHVHADGTAHRHAIDDDDDALAEHIQEPGCPCCWNMAIVVGVLPTPAMCTVAVASGTKLTFQAPAPYRDTEPNGPRRPPRPPSIA